MKALARLSVVSAIIHTPTLAAARPVADDPFADVVISYDSGVGPSPGYLNPDTALGPPERFTGEGIFPGVVSAFSPPFGIDEIVSIGAGGSLVVKFHTPVTNDSHNLYGIDLLIFGNTGFIDGAFPNGVVAGVFGNDGGTIEVSADGSAWLPVSSVQADGLFPTIGYSDSGPFDETAGLMPTNFTRPVDPALTLGHLMGLTNAQVVAKYRGSGGGAAIDIASTGLTHVSFVRINNPGGAADAIEIDAVSDAAPRLPGDVTLDGIVNIDDLLAVIGAWGNTLPGGVPADFDGNGVVNIDDLLTTITHWTT